MVDSIKEIVSRYDSTASLSNASTPPSAWYTDQEIFRLELRTVFYSSWQAIARAEQLSAPGRFVACDVGREPILAVRGDDGVLRGFYNVCRHHAAAVMTKSEGKTENLRCPYHGWTYDLTGALIHTPEFAGVADFDRITNGLAPVQVAEWHNWIFVRLEPAGLSLQEFLGSDLIDRLEPLSLERLNWFERRSYFLNCNWKVFVDNYLDGGYHVPHIHGGLAGVLDNRKYKTETGEHFCLQSSPIVDEKNESPTAAFRQGERANYYWIYPNFMINVYEYMMDTNRVIPHGVENTEVIFDYYFTDISDQAREGNLASIAVSEQIQAEDRVICESVQRGLCSRSYDVGRLSVRREAGEHLFHRLLYGDLKAGLTNQP